MSIVPTHASPTALRVNPTTPSFSDDQQWITAYLTIHMMSTPSYRVTYLLWFFIAFIFILVSLARCLRARTTPIGAYWLKWALRRRTWRKKHSLALARKNGPKSHQQPLSLPSNAQLLSVLSLFVVTLVLSFVGPDYIAPQVGVFDFINDAPIASTKRSTSYDPSQFVQYQPQYTIPKAWWTVGGRTGLVAFALFPLCVLLALKSPPFALFSIPLTAQIHFDKLSSIHRWAGRLIWFITAIHVVTWSVQLTKDSRSLTNKAAYIYAWQYQRFICGWIAFALLTLITVFSIRSIRQPHYEIFYFLHILLVPLMLISSALHHPPVQWWAYGALAIWVCERLYRVTWWLNTNGYFGGITANAPVLTLPSDHSRKYEVLEMKGINARGFPGTIPSSTTIVPSHTPASSQSTSTTFLNRRSSVTVDQVISPPSTYIPPPGYAHAELMPGRTVRMRIVTPGYRSWSPGQHFLISVPCVSRFTSHPFTVASICDEQSTSDSGRVLVFLIRAKAGWTKDLWDTIVRLMMHGQNTPLNETLPSGSHLPVRGVLMRTLIEGPFGSAIRTNWNKHSTAVIVTGGSGISFGLSILVYMCLCMNGHDGKYLGGSHGGNGRPKFSVSRVRFVWLAREFCHIQWCASILRRCMALVHGSQLQVDIFVTNLRPSPISNISNNTSSTQQPNWQQLDAGLETHKLRPPVTYSAEEQRIRPDSPDVGDDEAYGGLLDLSYYTGEGERQNDAWVEVGSHELDLTNFDGDDDTQLPGEAQLSYRFKKEGILRRARTRKLSRARRGGGRRTPEFFESDVDDHTRLPQKRASAQSTVNLITPQRDRKYDPPPLLSSLDIDPVCANASVPWDSVVSSGGGPVPASRPSDYGHGPKRYSGPASRTRSDVPSLPSLFDSRSDVNSVYALMPHTGVGAYGDEARIDFDEEEVRDVSVVAEHARPGRPKLDRLLAEEVEGSQGSIVVACCGPTSLNAVMRKYVAAQIDPGRIRRGDMRGSITLISEDFEY